MRVTNIEEAYRYFLYLINKDNTYTITPYKFNIIINSSMINWIKGILSTNEVNQTRIEDLSILFIDGSSKDRKIPMYASYANIPEDSMYNVRAIFDVEYKNSPCYSDGVKYKQIASLIKSDLLSAFQLNYYLKPLDSRMYYFYTEDKVKLLTGADSGLSESKGIAMYLDYYRYPKKLEYIDGGDNSDKFELKASQMQAVVEKAAQEFLEINRDPRYQSYLNEQVQRRQ